jgi:hypothetical protein
MGNHQMKTMIVAAIAALGLSVGAAYAQGVPAGFQGQAYGSQGLANSHHANGDMAASTKGG